MEISIDSRMITKPETTVFFALKGTNHDAHDYVESLYARGVRHFVVSEMRDSFKKLRNAEFTQTDNVLTALQQYAADYRRTVKVEIIAVTGSNGKTIVKEWIYQMLNDEMALYRSPRSYNSQVGVPLSLCGIPSDCQTAIIEAGISQPGEMAKLESMIQPDVCVFTHFGDAHGENFASPEAKLHEKAQLFAHAKVAIGRASAEMTSILAAAPQTTPMLWGESADVQVKTIFVDDQKRIVELSYNNQSERLTIPFGDEASFENCMNAVCVLLYKKIKLTEIVSKVSALQPIAMRLEIKEGINGTLLINDYYNSDATSFNLALNKLAMQDESKTRVVILSDFVNSTEEPQKQYANVANMLHKAGVKLFIGIGQEISRYKHYFLMSSRFYNNTDSFLKQEKKDSFHNQAILIKGARKFQFEYIAEFLQRQTHVTTLQVDLDAMSSNLTYFRSLLPQGTRMAVMVKAFSYGAGSVEVASLLQYQGVDYLMVAFADEGVALRAGGITVPIAVMNPQPDDFDAIISFNLEPEIYSFELLEKFDRALLSHGIDRYPVHLKLNTGMNRSGLDPQDIPVLLEFYKLPRQAEIRSMFSHLAGADETCHDSFTQQQLDLFISMTEQIQSHFDYHILRHILNSAGIERFTSYHFDMVRLGIGLHGMSAVGTKLQPVSSLKTYIAVVRDVPAGVTIGYGRKGITHRNSRIAVVPVGYADGLHRALSNGVGEMFVAGKRVPIIGNICMDACMLDVTDADVKVGDEVEVFGRHIPVSELADKTGTISYELLTAVAPRVKRVYFKE